VLLAESMSGALARWLEVKLTFSGGSDALLSIGDKGNGFHGASLNIFHVICGEVSEGGVLGSGEHLVVGELPCLTTGHGEELLEVVLDDHAGGIIDFGDDWSGVTHLLFE
jgi:hypothetical protein